jgi:putative flippase GtrA
MKHIVGNLPASGLSQIARFMGIGVCTASLDFGVMHSLVQLVGIGYFLATAVGFIVGCIVNYLFSIRWIFKSGRFERRRYEFSFFIIVSLFGLVINQIAMLVLVQQCTVHYTHAKVLTICVITVLNFVTKKYLVFLG